MAQTSTRKRSRKSTRAAIFAAKIIAGRRGRDGEIAVVHKERVPLQQGNESDDHHGERDKAALVDQTDCGVILREKHKDAGVSGREVERVEDRGNRENGEHVRGGQPRLAST